MKPVFRSVIKWYTTQETCIGQCEWLQCWTKLFQTRNETLRCVANDFRRVFVNRHSHHNIIVDDHVRTNRKQLGMRNGKIFMLNI